MSSFANYKQRKGCSRCGQRETAGLVGLTLRERPRGGAPKHITSTNRTFCEPCSIEVYERLLVEFQAVLEETDGGGREGERREPTKRPPAVRASKGLSPERRDLIVQMSRRTEGITAPDLAEALDLNVSTAVGVLKEAQRLGIISRAEEGRNIGRGRPQTLYRYVEPKPSSGPRTVRDGPTLRSSAPVAGTGRKTMSGGLSPEVRKLVQTAQAGGAQIEQTGSGHIRIRGKRGTVTMAATPSDHRSLKNTKADMRRAGIRVS